MSLSDADGGSATEDGSAAGSAGVAVEAAESAGQGWRGSSTCVTGSEFESTLVLYPRQRPVWLSEARRRLRLAYAVFSAADDGEPVSPGVLTNKLQSAGWRRCMAFPSRTAAERYCDAGAGPLKAAALL